jgi:hypothetical protein
LSGRYNFISVNQLNNVKNTADKQWKVIKNIINRQENNENIASSRLSL